MVIQSEAGRVFSGRGAATGFVVGTSGLDFGRLSVVAGSVRFFGFGFSDGGRGAGREASTALWVAFRAFSRRWRLRLSSRSFSRMRFSTMNPMMSDRAL